MEQKLIFLDIDGTLTSPGSNTPPESAMTAVRKAQAKGHQVFLCTGRNPAVLRALKIVCDNAHKNGTWVGICGELGADLALTETFLSIGIDELSVSPRSVLPLRQKIRETDVSKVKEKILADLLSDENAI